MSALARLPEQFVLAVREEAGSTAGITLPVPAAGIAYILDLVTFELINTSATLQSANLEIVDSQGHNYIQGSGVAGLVAASNTRDSDTITGPIQIFAGRGVTITFTAAAPASTAQQLTVAGHLL